jgi:ribosomal-protein-serine acetyltransferase
MLVPENATELFLLITENKLYLEHWFGWAHHIKSEADCLDFIQQSIQKQKTNQSFDFGIWLGDQLIGMVGLFAINWNHRHAEIGYWISEKHQGKGLVTQSVQAIMTYAFLEYKLNRIEILCSTDNMRSRALAERLNFKFEGVMREGYQFLGRFFDEACYSFLAKDFQVTGEEPYVQLARQICAP